MEKNYSLNLVWATKVKIMYIQPLRALPMQSPCLWRFTKPKCRDDGQLFMIASCSFREQKGRHAFIFQQLQSSSICYFMTAANFPHKRIILLKWFRVPKLSNFQTQSRDVHSFLLANLPVSSTVG